MQINHRQNYYRAWSNLTPPLRPHPDVVAAIKEQIKDRTGGRTLLLGVTPELADITLNLVAVDRNLSMISHIWPGNSSTRSAIVGDWRNSNFKAGVFDICIGDGSLCGLAFPLETTALFLELARVLNPAGRFICRLYLSPERAETIRQLKDEVMAGKIGNFHAFKMRLAMALAAKNPAPQVCVEAILEAFNTHFRDRDDLVLTTRWERAQIDTIDFYRSSSVVFNLPTQDQFLAVISKIWRNVRLVTSGSYEMSDRCPLLVADIA